MRNLLLPLCQKIAEFRIRRKASEVRSRRTDSDNKQVSAHSRAPSLRKSAADQASRRLTGSTNRRHLDIVRPNASGSR
jgi:hypothetical protein